LAARVQIQQGATAQGLETYRRALAEFPARRGLIYGYADALIDAQQAQQAADFLAEQAERNRYDPKLFELQAKVYAQLGKRLLRHRAQAEAYLLRGNVPAAVEQLQLARAAGEGDFYLQSSLEARLKELMEIEAESRRRE
jgi:predicted Zn-dependent protease